MRLLYDTVRLKQIYKSVSDGYSEFTISYISSLAVTLALQLLTFSNCVSFTADNEYAILLSRRNV